MSVVDIPTTNANTTHTTSPASVNADLSSSVSSLDSSESTAGSGSATARPDSQASNRSFETPTRGHLGYDAYYMLFYLKHARWAVDAVAEEKIDHEPRRTTVSEAYQHDDRVPARTIDQFFDFALQWLRQGAAVAINTDLIRDIVVHKRDPWLVAYAVARVYKKDGLDHPNLLMVSLTIHLLFDSLHIEPLESPNSPPFPGRLMEGSDVAQPFRSLSNAAVTDDPMNEALSNISETVHDLVGIFEDYFILSPTSTTPGQGEFMQSLGTFKTSFRKLLDTATPAATTPSGGVTPRAFTSNPAIDIPRPYAHIVMNQDQYLVMRTSGYWKEELRDVFALNDAEAAREVQGPIAGPSATVSNKARDDLVDKLSVRISSLFADHTRPERRSDRD